MDQWLWMMNYCQKQRIPPAQAWAWEQAKKAYKEMKYFEEQNAKTD